MTKRSKPAQAPEPLTLGRLRSDWRRYGEEVRERLEAFAAFRTGSDEALFKELCFCILAANSSAEMGIKTVAAVEDLLWEGPLDQMQGRLSKGFRYWRLRPAYIVHTREWLRSNHGLRLGAFLAGFDDDLARRNFLAESKGFKGLGYKEASHFLRNVGYSGYAILDKHILNCLRELGVIGQSLRPSNPRRYLLIEKRMRRWSAEIGIGMDELDLLLWRWKTGKILK